MFCKKCGREISADSKFCPNCGTKIHENVGLNEADANTPQTTETYSSESLSLLDNFDKSLCSILYDKCEKIKTINSNHHSFQNPTIVMNQHVLSHLHTLTGFTTWSNVPQSSKINIEKKFTNSTGLGKKVGFIDSGMLLKKGKTGVLFYEGGIAIRGMMDSTDSFISYDTLCSGVIRKKDNFLIDGHKLKVINDKLIIIEPSNKMCEKLEPIRRILLSSDESSKSVFYSVYFNAIEKIEQFADKNINIAKEWTEFLYEFVESNKENGYHLSKEISVILSMIQHEFDGAKKLAEQINNKSLIELVLEKHLSFKKIMNQQSYDEAEKYYNENEYKKAIISIREAISYFSTVESWRLFVEIVCKGASEENCFFYEEYSYLNHLTANSPDEQIQVLIEKRKELESLWDKIEKYCTARAEIIIDLIRSNHVALAESINTPNRSPFMHPIMYAALKKNKDCFNILRSVHSSYCEKNILGLDYFDLVAFSSRNLEDYLTFVEDLDDWYVCRKKIVS